MSDVLEGLSAGGGGKTIRVGGGEVFVAERGTGVPVVALHAIGHGSGDYVPLAERAGARFRFSMVDWPGHGRSPRGVAPTAAAYAELLAQLIPKLSSEPVVLLGNSIGGAAALTVAARHPELVRGLVLCDAGGLAPVGAIERFAIGTFARFFAAGARGASWFPGVFRAYYRMVLPREPAAARRRAICAASRETAPLLAEAWRSFAEPRADLRELVPRVKVPVWLAWSKHDRIIPFGASRAAAEGFREHAVTLFPGGHSAFLEAPDEFAAAFAERFGARVKAGITVEGSVLAF